MKAVVLVEGESDRIAVETLAVRRSRKRSLPLEAQFHDWLHNWKVRYAAALVNALDLDRVPAPLADVLAYVGSTSTQRPGQAGRSSTEHRWK